MKKLLILLLIVGCDNSTESTPMHGCLDSEACNYDSTASIDNNSCAYEYDCADVCGGDTQIDLCGVCGGNGLDDDSDGICDDIDDCVVQEGKCDCDGTTVDCAGECGQNVELWSECYNILTTIELNLNDNFLTDSIPKSIGDLVNLKIISLYNNQLSGEIPSEIGNLTSLEKLLLSNNQLSGEIPSEIYNLNLLNELKLSNNNLSGNIDTLICSMESLFPGPNENGGNLYEQENPTPIGLGQNSFCPEYPICLERSPYRPLLGQDKSNCP